MKKFNLITIFSSIAISLLISISTVATVTQAAVNNLEIYDSNTNYLSNSTYDFKVFSPTMEQIETFELNEDIISVLPFYKSNAEVLLKNGINSHSVTAVFSDPKYDLEITEFNNTRLLTRIESQDNQAEIFIDKETAERSGANLGDLVTVRLTGKKDILFKITRIYDNFYFYNNPTVFFYYTSDIKLVIDNNSEIARKIEGAYLKADNVSVVFEYLQKNYIPLGDLLPFTDEYFTTQSEYNQYVLDFKRDFLGESIFNRQNALNLALEENKTRFDDAHASFSLTYLLFFISIIIISLKVLFGLINSKQIEQDTGSLEKSSNYLFAYLTTDLSVGLLSSILVLLYKRFNSEIAVAYLATFTNKIFIIIGVATLINILISLLASFLPSLKSLKKDKQ